MMPRIVACAILFVMLASTAHALGISPSTILLNWTSGEEILLNIVAINNRNTSNSVEAYSRGDFAGFIQFYNGTNFSVGPRQKVTIPFSLKMPKSLPNSGTYETRIGVVEKSDGKSMLNAVVAVESRLIVNAALEGELVSNTTQRNATQQRPVNQSIPQIKQPVSPPTSPPPPQSNQSIQENQSQERKIAEILKEKQLIIEIFVVMSTVFAIFVVILLYRGSGKKRK